MPLPVGCVLTDQGFLVMKIPKNHADQNDIQQPQNKKYPSLEESRRQLCSTAAFGPTQSIFSADDEATLEQLRSLQPAASKEGRPSIRALAPHPLVQGNQPNQPGGPLCAIWADFVLPRGPFIPLDYVPDFVPTTRSVLPF